MTVRVVTAAQATACDRAAIDAGVPSRALMQRAGVAAVAEIARVYAGRMRRGVAVFAGPGNNGGDAWVVAAALSAVGIRARVVEIGDAKTDDARAERELARAVIDPSPPSGAEDVIVDGVLGTGTTGAPRGAAADAIQRINTLAADGAAVVSLDIPSGVDATTGDATAAVRADLTITFGTMKRGLLVARGHCGRIVVVDIGLGHHASGIDDAPELVDASWVRRRIPPIAADAHKGVRRRLVVMGGAPGMAGASILAAKAALRSGVGMARVVAHPASVSAVQSSVHAALARPWPETDNEIQDSIVDWAHAVVIGPGLGLLMGDTRSRLERVLAMWRGPVVLDADALTAFAGDSHSLAEILGGRPALITPHVVEFSRLLGASPESVLASRFDIGRELAATLNATVLLKGVPTIVHAPDGRSVVIAAGTPALATGGSGDLLAGIAGTLIAQMTEPLEAAACAAWVHGRASEVASGARQSIRGVTLDDVLAALPAAWADEEPERRPPILAELPAVGDRRASAPL